jgi:hypothetical protein
MSHKGKVAVLGGALLADVHSQHDNVGVKVLHGISWKVIGVSFQDNALEGALAIGATQVKINYLVNARNEVNHVVWVPPFITHQHGLSS